MPTLTLTDRSGAEMNFDPEFIGVFFKYRDSYLDGCKELVEIVTKDGMKYCVAGPYTADVIVHEIRQAKERKD